MKLHYVYDTEVYGPPAIWPSEFTQPVTEAGAFELWGAMREVMSPDPGDLERGTDTDGVPALKDREGNVVFRMSRWRHYE